MKRLFGHLLIVIISLIVAYQIVAIWRGFTLYQLNPSRENLFQAIKISPSNPDPYYRLALFYQWDLQNCDLNKSIQYFEKAIERNPFEQQHWINLARALHRSGQKEASEKAIENAVKVFPTGYQGRWVGGNLLLQQGEIEKAISHFTYLLLNYPEQTGLIYDLLTKAIEDKDILFDKVVPKDPSSIMRYLNFLYEARDKESAKRVWAKKSSYGLRPDQKETVRYIDFLIGQGGLQDAHQAWIAMLREMGFPTPEDGNLITNGGFEKKDTLGTGFDWRIGKVEGAEVSIDSSTAFEGKASLRIDFNGKENVDFHHLYQYVAWQPNKEYRLKLHMRTQGVTTKSGVKVEVLGLGVGFHQTSESLTGDNDWKELAITFRAPINSQGGIVRLRREKTQKFDRFIAGRVWVDNVSLTEKR